MVICLERCAGLHTAQRMPLPLTVSCFSKIQIGFTFLLPAHPGSPGQRAVKEVCVYWETKGASQNNHQSVCRCPQADWNRNVLVLVDRCSLSCVSSLFRARGAATEKTLRLIRQRVHVATRPPDDETESEL